MSLVNSAFTVNVTPGAMPPVVHVSEYDVGRTYTVTINGENGSAFNIPTGTTATIEGTLNGSVGFTQSATISNNQVSFALTESMTAYSGKAWCKIKLTLNDEPIQTCAFILAVDRAGVEAETVIGAPGFDEQIRDAVDDWLESDEGIGDAVQTAVNDYADEHGLVLSNGFVTPEDYGARGNGVTDDTAAIQLAVNSGKNVVFGYQKTYRCGQINVTKNIEIDCRWSEFVCTAEKLFYCHGTVTESISGADYVAYMPYALPNNDKYTGLAMLESSDNVFTDRDYLYGGFMADFADGVCKERKPVAFTGVAVNKLNPITCAIKNIGKVSFTGTGTALTYGVKIEYGLNCVVSDYCIDGAYYSAVTFKKCKYCKADNIHGFLNWAVTENAYPVEFLDSSNCVLSDSQIYAKPWACFSIGGNYICYDNRIENSTLIAYGSNNGVGSHSNAIGTIIENVVSTAIHLGAGGRLKNCKILASVNGEATKGTITLAASTVDGVADFYVDGVDFLFEPDVTPPSGVEIFVGTDTQTNENSFFVHNVTVKNVKTNAPERMNYIRFFDFGTPGSGVTSVTANGLLNFENVCGFYGMKINAEPKVIFDTKCKMIIRNCNGEIANNKYILGLGANGAITKYPPLVEIANCDLHAIAGTFAKLRFNNVKFDGSIGGYSGDLLIAEDVDYIPVATIQSFTKARIVNMRRTEDQIWAYTSHDSGASYKLRYTSTGIVTEVL